MARGKVKRNVVELCSVPQGQAGRSSKALTFAQAEAVLKVAEGTSMHAYVVLALLTGARTEELRALTWDHGFLKGKPDADPPQPPTSRCGARSGPAETPRHGSHGARSAGALRRSPLAAVRRSGLGRRWRQVGGTRTGLLLQPWASRSKLPTFAGSSIKRSGNRRDQFRRMDASRAPAQLRVSAPL
jgi:hypothetical protein